VPKLDRIPYFDERSRAYNVRTLLPGSVDRQRKIWAVPSDFPLDQGDVGACVGHGFTGELAADPIVVPDANQSYAWQLYALAQAEDRKMGNNWPEGASMLAGCKALKNAGKISSYRWAFTIDDVINTLCTIGPVTFGIEWRRGMFTPGSGGLLSVTGPVDGGHCILGIGYLPDHPAGEVVALLNSWGRGWGIQGVGYIRVADLAALLKADGEAAVVLDVKPLAPEPGPLYVASRHSRCFHVKGAHWWLPEVRAWTARADALAAGLRPCSWCKP
jgi:hypothetical protein